MPTAPPGATITDVRIAGRLFGLFSFDIGYEIDLDRVRALVSQGETRGMEKRRAAPAYLAYATPPLRVPLRTRELELRGQTVSAKATATIHEFGAVTVAFEMPLTCDVEALAGLTATLTGAGPLEAEARLLLQDLYQRILPAVAKPELNLFVEDYYVIQTDRVEPAIAVGDLIARAGGSLAAALRCEPMALSEAETEEVFRTRLSYYPSDLVVTEWNVALIVDPDYRDALNVLEFLNVQLVELRYYDALLDRRVADTYGLTAHPQRLVPLAYRPYQRVIDELAAVRLDVATIFERIHNALKLSGSLYVAKLYSRTAERLGLRMWEESVARKLEVLQKMYDVLVQRVAWARAEVLELTIIVLIAVEIVLALWGLA